LDLWNLQCRFCFCLTSSVGYHNRTVSYVLMFPWDLSVDTLQAASIRSQEVCVMQQGAVEYLLRWRNGGTPGPYILNVRLTDACNLLCKSCDKGLDSKDRVLDRTKELSDTQLLRLIEDAADMGVRYLLLDGGGEPLLRRGVAIRMMEEAKRRGMEGFLVTNGTLLQEKAIRTLVKIGWDHVHFSIDGPDAATHDYLRGVPGCFNAALRNIQRMVLHREEAGTRKPQISIATVLSNANYHRLGDMVELAHSLGIEGFYLQPLYTITPSSRALILSDEQRAKFYEGLSVVESVACGLGLYNNLHHFHDARLVGESNRLGDVVLSDTKRAIFDIGEQFLSAPCYSSWIYLGVRPDGSIAPCPSVPAGFHGCLNIKTSSLKEIWHGHFFTHFRRRMAERELYPFCRTCCGGMVIDTRDYREAVWKRLGREQRWTPATALSQSDREESVAGNSPRPS